MLRFVLLGLFALVATGAAQANAEKRAVVFDIDGTLTPNVFLIGTARPHAAQVAQAFADAGIKVVYLTARVPFFQAGLSDWLADEGFPAGDVHLTLTDADEADHAAFKTRILQDYETEGWQFVAAYGDSTTDFTAYAAAGIPQARVFALRRWGAGTCKPGVWQGCFDDWEVLGQSVAALVAS